ncbi:MAG: putative PEP-binding protein [Solirubrobacterales bacterium]
MAVEHGAEGVGLCRTEHQFLGARLPLVQRLILAGDPVEEQAALDALAAAREDFRGLLAAVDGRPITIRLLDPPCTSSCRASRLMVDDALGRLDEVGRALLRAAREWAETNPMLGTRGVRLALLKPALYPAQARALFEAAAEQVADGGRPQLEIMIPLVVDRREVAAIARLIREQADVVERSTGIVLDYRIGTMIETPRAALVAGEIATEAEFFSFGTNDLTQLTFGFSRDDVEARP